MKYTIYLVLALLLSSFITNCAITTSSYRYISYTDESYAPRNTESIEIFQSRLSITSKYNEIGVIKIADDYNLSRIKHIAAEQGADGIIVDIGNAVLIKFIEQQEKEELYEISI